jgi:HEAT repeat protein
MSFKQICLVVMLLVIGQTVLGQEEPTQSVSTAPTKVELDEQLEINKNALFQDPSEQIRIKAATVMLFSENPLAREILISTLKQSENKAARVAVCKALSQTKVTKTPIEKKSDFIQPLLDVLTTEDAAGAQLAAEATLIFEYGQISEQLEKIVTDSSLPVKARLNAIYALKRPLDKRAIFKLLDLLEDPNGQVAAEADKTLRSLGISVGKDPAARKEVRDKLKHKGMDEFLWDLLSQKEDRIRELLKERDAWRNQYLSALDKIYNLTGDAAKGQFLAERLSSSETIVKLWALDKARQIRLGTGTEKSKFPVELGPILVGLVSDADREVRLQTAKLLSLMGDLNSAEKLLQQFKIEQDDEVKMELFTALGGACYYAFLPDSPVKIPAEIRKQTLEEATKYLAEADRKKAQKGAEVIKKLLEQDGLEKADVQKYLGSLAERYKREKDNADGSLRGELLSAMAALCAQSVYNAQAKERFEPLFQEALSDKTDLVREAAVDGLINVDKTKALTILRKSSVNDSSTKIRGKVIELAGQVGGKEDLDWLWEKMGTGPESGPAWVAMLRIFGGSEADLLDKWMSRFDSEGTGGRLSDEQLVSYLKIAERKIDGEKQPAMLKNIRKRLAGFYSNSGKFEEAADYLGKLYEAARTAEEKRPIVAELLGVYLRWSKIERAAQLVNNRLLEGDLEPNSSIAASIDNYIGNPPAGADPNSVLEAFFAKVKTTEGRPNWTGQVKRWTERFNRPEMPDEPKSIKPEDVRK